MPFLLFYTVTLERGEPFMLTAVRAQETGRVGPIEVVRCGSRLGAEIRGVDLTGPIDDATIVAINDALMAHKVLFFRAVDITPQQHIAFGRRFGKLTVHPFGAHLEGVPEVSVLDNHKDNPVFTTDVWHSDETFRLKPPVGSILRCVCKPDVGGDTLWADMSAAYEGLSSKMQSLVSGLEAVHDFINFRRRFDHLPPREKHEKLAKAEEESPNPTHPVVLTHPVTEAKILYVNRQFTHHIVGMRDDESRMLLDFLYAQAAIPEYQVRFHWEVNSMAFWDNRPTQHYAANDYYPQRRTMQRVTVRE
jgi:taurine dioxygenase